MALHIDERLLDCDTQSQIVENFNRVLKMMDVLDVMTIVFNSNGGTAVATQYELKGGKVIEPTAPTKEHYAFDGWYADAELTTAWNFDTDTVQADMTLYAKWQIDTHTVTFDTDGGSEVEAQTIEYGGKVTEPSPAPTKESYAFGGWYKDAELTAEWAFATDTVTGDTTIYAKWTEAEA